MTTKKTNTLFSSAFIWKIESWGSFLDLAQAISCSALDGSENNPSLVIAKIIGQMDFCLHTWITTVCA